MIRRMSLVTIMALLAVTLVMGAAEVTFVLKNGERHSGTLVYHGTGNVNLIIGGTERSFPFDDIALIAFTRGDPPRNEIAALPESADPPELDRHTLVFRDGRMIRGKLHDFKGDQISYDVREDGRVSRRLYGMGEVARLYLSAPATRSLFGVTGTQPVTQPEPPGTGGAVVQVEANRQWTSTGLRVTRGERVSFSTTGEITVAPDMTSGPDGNSSLPRGFGLPVRKMGVGGLIGRIGNGPPFPIGSNTQPLTMGQNGVLMLGINDMHLADNSGRFTVRVTR